MSTAMKTKRQVQIASYPSYRANTCAKPPVLLNLEGWKCIGENVGENLDENIYETDDPTLPEPFWGHPPKLSANVRRLGGEIAVTLDGTIYQKEIEEPCGCKQFELVILPHKSTLIYGVRRRWFIDESCPHNHKRREHLIRRIFET